MNAGGGGMGRGGKREVEGSRSRRICRRIKHCRRRIKHCRASGEKMMIGHDRRMVGVRKLVVRHWIGLNGARRGGGDQGGRGEALDMTKQGRVPPDGDSRSQRSNSPGR
jgi:hypothetical protein